MSRRFSPSEDDRRTVRAMAGFGVPQDDIAIHLDVDPKTLRKHFRRELDRGTIEANAKVAQTLFTMATVDKNVAAVIFWLKARAGWREKHPTDGEAESKATTIVYRWMDEGEEVPPAPTPTPRSPRRIARVIDHE